MASLSGLARERTDLTDDDIAHLQSVVADWTLLADLAFGDLVMWLPTWNDGGFVAGAQVRPSTGPTQVPDDVVGRFLPRGRRPELDTALATARPVLDRSRTRPLVPRGPEAVPVRRGGRVVAVVSRHTWLPEGRGDGQLEEAYLRTADDLMVMLADAAFPPARVWRPPTPRRGSVTGCSGSPARAGLRSPAPTRSRRSTGSGWRWTSWAPTSPPRWPG